MSDLERPPKNPFTISPTWLLIRLLVVTKAEVVVVLTVLGVMIELASQTSEEVPELSIIVIDTVHRVQETMEAEKIGLPVVAVPAEEGARGLDGTSSNVELASALLALLPLPLL